MTFENNAFKLLITSFLLFFALHFSQFAFAQEDAYAPVADSPDMGGTIVQEEPGSPRIESPDRFNPVWLLPLIVIPILLFMLWPRKRNNPMDLSASSGYAGIKGGRASSTETDKIKRFLEANIP